jgi:hypothetical protein
MTPEDAVHGLSLYLVIDGPSAETRQTRLGSLPV